MKRLAWRTGIRGRWLLGLSAAAAFTLSFAVLSAQAAPAGQSTNQGEVTFQSKCAGCHSIGGGVGVGPDLKGVTARRSHDWLVSWITAPDRMIAQGDPTAKTLSQQFPVPMPNLGLSQTEVEAVLAYIENQSGGGAAPAAPAAAPLPAADAAVGKEYFTGLRPFQNGGSPCLACHSVAGIGALGGGAVGPDLTGVLARYGGEAGLAGVLGNIPFPTMRPIFVERSLTSAEQANLIAFLKAAPLQTRQADAVLILAGLAVLGALLLLAIFQLIWRKRLANVRKPMLGGTKWVGSRT